MGLKLNLGCGNDVRIGYVNVDADENTGATEVADLSKLPWRWKDSEADEIMMLDFLEHFPYRDTKLILGECWRVLKPGGKLVVQVPDFEHCALAVLAPSDHLYLCNKCGEEMDEFRTHCTRCGQSRADIQDAAIHRLYGGQDRKGNWHFTAFTKDILVRMLRQEGFGQFENLEIDHQWANWNFKIQATKEENCWGD